MTNHWRDIRHADLILINGANPAEAHPVGFQWFMRAKLERGAKIIHADPRFTRTSAVADRHVRIRTGTDIAYFGGLINYVLENKLYHEEYVRWATNAGLVVTEEGNIGRPGGGMNAERGHANIQGNTDHAISWEILPGYLRIPAPGQRSLADYVDQSASKKLRPNAVNFFGTNYRKFMVSLLKTWYGDAATKHNEFAFDHLPKPAGNTSWISIFDQALQGKMEGLMLSGMTATSIGPDSNQVLQALSNLKWLCVMDAFPTTSSEFWRAPGIDPSKVQTEVFLLPTTHWIEKDGSFTNSGRWAQWKDQVLPPEGDARHDHWILADLFQRVRNLYRQQGGKFRRRSCSSPRRTRTRSSRSWTSSPRRSTGAT
jgi:anaerobic selenocysteine-containing dehydrogenase